MDVNGCSHVQVCQKCSRPDECERRLLRSLGRKYAGLPAIVLLHISSIWRCCASDHDILSVMSLGLTTIRFKFDLTKLSLCPQSPRPTRQPRPRPETPATPGGAPSTTFSFVGQSCTSSHARRTSVWSIATSQDAGSLSTRLKRACAMLSHSRCIFSRDKWSTYIHIIHTVQYATDNETPHMCSEVCSLPTLLCGNPAKLPNLATRPDTPTEQSWRRTHQRSTRFRCKAAWLLVRTGETKLLSRNVKLQNSVNLAERGIAIHSYLVNHDEVRSKLDTSF